MSKKLTIVVYHYVRDTDPEFSGIHARTPSEFERQLKYLEKHYTFIRAETLLHGETLPEKAALLTFDDGYVEHYDTVLPVLDQVEAKGCFFVPVRSHLERKVLPVNKLHFILAGRVEVEKLVQAVDDCLETCTGMEPRKKLWKKINEKPHYDAPDVLYVKRMLQRELPEKERNELIDELFAEHVTKDEKTFADDLYLNETQMRKMLEQGHYIGGHGYSHNWFTNLDEKQLDEELASTTGFLSQLGVPTDRWMLAYPFGGYTPDHFPLLTKHGCKVALTVKHGIAEIIPDNMLELPRLDTNELPF